jgi:hypothetical protein
VDIFAILNNRFIHCFIHDKLASDSSGDGESC